MSAFRSQGYSVISNPDNNPDKHADCARSLEQWLAWLEHLHPEEIDLGLQRVSAVAARAGLMEDLPTLVTVAGTNGKGSVVAMLSAIYLAADFRVGSYTSPHLTCFNERICIDGQMASDQQIVTALAWVEGHRQDQSLTYFEFTTLAAMHLYQLEKVDVIILEVGLGGRLDAVNIWDTDCAVVTSIAVDHESWLGHDRDTIGNEKVGIARPDTPLVVGDTDPPPVLARHAAAIAARLWQSGVDFTCKLPDEYDPRSVDTAETLWQLALPHRNLSLPAPSLQGEHQYYNAATAVASVETLQSRLPVSDSAIRTGLRNASLRGRFERLRIDGMEIVLDVAHNPSAAEALVSSLYHSMGDRKAHAVFAIMSDKDTEALVATVSPCVASWHCGELEVPRAFAVNKLVSTLLASGVDSSSCHGYPDIASAYAGATDACRAEKSDGYILVFGSFFTVTAALALPSLALPSSDRPCH